jgi:hypothetical protein
VAFAALGVAVVVLVAVVLIWVLAPDDPEEIELPEFVPPPAVTTTLPGATTLPPLVTTTSAPG